MTAPAIISAGASILGSILSRPRGQKATGLQKRKEALLDELLAGVKGQGPFANLFSASPEAFQQGFVDPAMSRFQNVIAPGIQQRYVGMGQQRGTGIQDELARAGVSLSDRLNEQYFNYQQGAQNRGIQAILSALGAQTGEGAPGMSAGEAAQQGIGGVLTSDKFGSALENIFSSAGGSGSGSQAQAAPPQRQWYRKGFQN